MHVCKQCKTEFDGAFCPNCGAEFEQKPRPRAKRGCLSSLFRFLGSLLLIAFLVIAALVILDCTAYAHDPSNTIAYAIVSGARNMLPERALTVYETLKGQVFELWALFWKKLRA